MAIRAETSGFTVSSGDDMRLMCDGTSGGLPLHLEDAKDYPDTLSSVGPRAHSDKKDQYILILK